MIQKFTERTTEIREKMRGGEGRVALASLLKPEYLPKKCRLFSELRLEKGCGIGGHTHENETELFYVLSGEAVYDDNGSEKILKAGDVAVCPGGESHSVKNEQESPLILLAVIILD